MSIGNARWSARRRRNHDRYLVVAALNAAGVFCHPQTGGKTQTPAAEPVIDVNGDHHPFAAGHPYSLCPLFCRQQDINDLLQPAVVALAFPLYEQLHQIRARWKSIISVCFIGSVVAMVTGTAIALWMGATPEIAASVLPKSVTTPIAMATAQSINGIPAISAVCVIFVGILGAVFGHTILNILQITTKASRGLAMGTASHALGTARCAEVDFQEGAFSSLALVICGIITSLLAPFLFPVLLAVFG